MVSIRRKENRNCLIAYMFRVLCTYFNLIFLDLKRFVHWFSVSVFFTFINNIWWITVFLNVDSLYAFHCCVHIHNDFDPIYKYSLMISNEREKKNKLGWPIRNNFIIIFIRWHLYWSNISARFDGAVLNFGSRSKFICPNEMCFFYFIQRVRKFIIFLWPVFSDLFFFVYVLFRLLCLPCFYLWSSTSLWIYSLLDDFFLFLELMICRPYLFESVSKRLNWQ